MFLQVTLHGAPGQKTWVSQIRGGHRLSSPCPQHPLVLVRADHWGGLNRLSTRYRVKVDIRGCLHPPSIDNGFPEPRWNGQA